MFSLKTCFSLSFKAHRLFYFSPLSVGNARNESSHMLHDGRWSATASGYEASQEHHGNQKNLDHEFSVPSLPQEKLYQDLLVSILIYLHFYSTFLSPKQVL